MNLWTKVILLPTIFLTSSLAMAMNPVGLWASLDEKTGEKRAIIKISEEKNILEATIVKIYKRPGETGICSECPGDFKNKPIVGLKFGWGFVPTAKETWSKGHILDPKTGKIYKANMKLENENNLAVRGYIGVSLIGRTQVWHREG